MNWLNEVTVIYNFFIIFAGVPSIIQLSPTSSITIDEFLIMLFLPIHIFGITKISLPILVNESNFTSLPRLDDYNKLT